MPTASARNLSVQREVFKNAKLEVAYVANKNNHWEQRSDVNFVPKADRLTYVQNENSTAKAGSPDLPPGFADAGAYLASFRPYGAVVGNNSINYYSHGSSSNYQALQEFFNPPHRRPTTFQTPYNG